MSGNFHRAFGCYGIGNRKELVVIKKLGGPYINRYDLPGGSLEDGEEIDKAVIREINEETGLIILQYEQVGVTSFRYPWNYKKWHYNQHICVLYDIKKIKGELQPEVRQFKGQDSLGAIRINLEKLTIANSSPLVILAKAFLTNKNTFTLADQTFAEWKVLDQPAF